MNLVFKVLRELCEKELARKRYAEMSTRIMTDKEVPPSTGLIDSNKLKFPYFSGLWLIE